VFNQREVGSDTKSMQTALKNALRQAPDVILVGEIRDREGMCGRHRLRAVGPPVPRHHARQQQLPGPEPYPVVLPRRSTPTMLGDLGAALKAVVSQRLLRTVHGSRTPAVEVLLNTKLISELIEKGDFSGIKEAMVKSMAEGSQTFEQGHRAPDRRWHRGEEGRPGLRRFADQPAMAAAERFAGKDRARPKTAPRRDMADEPSFTEITLDVDWALRCPASCRTLISRRSVTPETVVPADHRRAAEARWDSLRNHRERAGDFRSPTCGPSAPASLEAGASRTLVFAAHTECRAHGPLENGPATLHAPPGRQLWRGAADMKIDRRAFDVAGRGIPRPPPDPALSCDALLLPATRRPQSVDGTVVVCATSCKRAAEQPRLLHRGASPASVERVGAHMIQERRRRQHEKASSPSKACQGHIAIPSWPATRSTRHCRRWPNWRR
jgi:hypothetical protein